ncbi:MAG: DUF4349 domain-containing protein [Actinomycetota bacterium]
MNTDIEYLRQLEADLKAAADGEVARLRAATTASARRRRGQMWMKVAGVAAAFVIVAGAIGFLTNGNDATTKFSEVGEAVDAGSGGAGDAFDDAPAAPAASPTAAPPGVGSFLDDDGGQRGQRDLSKIVRDGRIGIVVGDDGFGDAVGELTFVAERHGGFVLSSSTDNERSGTFVLRIPARRFDRAIADIRALASRVRFQEIRGDDVTAEFIDFQARLRILQARRTLLFGLLQDAATTDEILRLSGQLDDVQLRIEQIQGQLRFLNDQVAESTLRVSIRERNAPTITDGTDVDNPDLGSSFELGVQGFLRIVGAVIVGMGYLLPITAIAAVAWLAVWFVRRRRATA